MIRYASRTQANVVDGIKIVCCYPLRVQGLVIQPGKGCLMTATEAREYFKNKGLSFDDIGKVDFNQLHTNVGIMLDVYRNKTDHARQMDMRVRKISPRDKKFDKGKLVRGKILINGSYFHSREGITFHENGFIGFCGEFSDVNSEPVLEAFVKWCDELAEV